MLLLMGLEMLGGHAVYVLASESSEHLQAAVHREALGRPAGQNWAPIGLKCGGGLNLGFSQ